MARFVGMLPTYREGPLAASAARTLFECCDVVLSYEGPVGNAPETGDPTEWPRDLQRNSRLIRKHGTWTDEVAKRNAMLDFTRRYDPPVWGVYLDADEILLGARWVPDLVYAAERNAEEGRAVSAIPLLIQEVDYSVGRIHRLIRLDLLKRHVLSMSQMVFFGSEVVVTFPVIPTWRPGQDMTPFQRPPMEGEPHIHHRSYYRPKARTDFRLHKEEANAFLDLERQALARLGFAPDGGGVPIHQDPGLIVARDTGEVEPLPSILDQLERGTPWPLQSSR